jgi:hypothetical protein
MGERSLSRERECLSPPVPWSPHERAALTPALQSGASAPRKVRGDRNGRPVSDPPPFGVGWQEPRC